MAFGADVLDGYPSQYTERGSSVGVECREHRAHGAVECGTTIEAEPSEPDEDCADEDESGVVRFAVDLVAFVETLAKAGCDVDGTASCEVEGGEVE
jgi:hypothetical protein